MKIVENHINRTENYGFGDEVVTDIEDTVLDGMTHGEMFRWFSREHGRCVSKVYVDLQEGTKPVGWVFQKRERYEDTKETFIHETWITLMDAIETTTYREYHTIGGK